LVDRSVKSWLMIAFLVCLLLLGAGGVGGAQEQPTDENVWSTPTSQDADFQKRWDQRREAVAAGDVGEQQLEEILQLKLDRGSTNLWEYAILLMREGMALEDKERAVELGEFAQRMAPDLPPAYFYTAHTIVKKGSLNFYAALENNVEGVRAYFRNIPLTSGKGLNFLYIAGLAVLLTVLTFCLMVFFKRLPIFFQALEEELQGSTKEIIWGVGRIFLLALPFLLQLNILWCALVWSLILWRYLTRGEKGLVILAFLFVVYIPPAGDALFQSMQGSRSQVVFDMYEASYGARKAQAVERLRLWAQDHPDDRDALFTLALAFKREGDYVEAKKYYQNVIRLNASDVDAISNLGNLYIAIGDPETASSLYNQAIELAPSNGIYYFNLSKALTEKSMLVLEEADKNFQKAKELSPQIIGDHLKIDSSHPNRSVIDVAVPLERLWKRLFGGLWHETGPSYFVLDVWLRDLSPRLPFIVPVLFLVSLVVFSYGGKGRGEWWRCSLCGMISNQTQGKQERRKRICVRCFRILKGKEMGRDMKESKLRETKVFQIRMGIYDKLFPLLLPGMGYIWKGYNVRGVFYLWIFFVFVGVFFHWKGIIPPPYPSSAYGMVGGVFVMVMVFAVFYVLALWGGYKKQGLEISKPTFSLEGIRR
jgi:tetratricopeptide (TPR) repeat protein